MTKFHTKTECVEFLFSRRRERIMSIKALQEYTRISKYAKYLPTKHRRETWIEQCDRVFEMHRQKFNYCKDEIEPYLQEAEKALQRKEILGSQRALQFGGQPILDKNTRLYNCCSSYCDRVDFFKEFMYVLLCGCGAGFSVQHHHINKLPLCHPRDTTTPTTFTIPDSIEGWADSIKVLMESYLHEDSTKRPEIIFDYSEIRPEGAPIRSGGKAPGPNGLRKTHEKIVELLDRVSKGGPARIKSIDCYDCCMHIADSVLSGGIRRSATICLFSPDDQDMQTAKTGSWFHENPQRGRSNNSAILIRDKTSREEFAELMKSVREYGEPGFIWSDDTEVLFNPCAEISFCTKDEEGNSGWGFCNLSEINMRKAQTEEKFYEQCRHAAIIGTLQAAYTDFEYLGVVTERIVRKEALLGVSMTGMMDNPEIAFNPKILKNGAKIVLDINEEVSKIIGINPAARCTCVKPAGTSSCILGTSSGIHPHHATRYFRHVQENKFSATLEFFKKYNPLACEESVWSTHKTDDVIKFLCEVPVGSKTKNQINALELLERVRLTQQNWVEFGTRPERNILPCLRHNVSNTCFTADTRFLTTDGIKSFKDFIDGDKVVVFDYEGKEREGLIKNFGQQEIYKVTFESNKQEKIVYTTKDHIWLTINRYSKFNKRSSLLHNFQLVRTADLTDKKHQQFPKIYPEQMDFDLNPEAFCHGYVFGDGSKNYSKESNKCFIYIHDDCREDIVKTFLDYDQNLKPIEKETHTRIYSLPASWKDLPQTKDPEYLFSFVAGWFAADGYCSHARTGQCAITLTHKNKNNLEWLFNIAPIIRIGINPPTSFTPKQGYKPGDEYFNVSFVTNTLSDRFFILHPKKYENWRSRRDKTQAYKYYSLKSVEKTNKVEDVWCVYQPETSTFLLENGLLTHNCNVKEHEWDDVEKFIYRNRKWFAGISLLPMSGDKDYAQAPFTAVFTPQEIVKEYGDAAILASGLIVDGLRCFNDNLWTACDAVLGIGKIPLEVYENEQDHIIKGDQWDTFRYRTITGEQIELPGQIFYQQKDWLRRAKQFAARYFNGNIKKMTYCLKDVRNWKVWCDLRREYKEVPWEDFHENGDNTQQRDIVACGGGQCEII